MKVEALGMQGHHITQLMRSVYMFPLELCLKVTFLGILALNLRAIGSYAGLLIKVETLETDVKED